MAENEPSSKYTVLSAIRVAESAREPAKRLEAVRKLRELSSEYLPMELMVDCGVLPILVDFLRRDSEPDLQFESTWILTNVTAGTCEQVDAVIDAGALPRVSKLLYSRSQAISHQALWIMGNIVVDRVENRDKVIDLGVLSRIGSLIRPDMSLEFTRTISWFVWNVCSHENPQVSREAIIQILPAIRDLLSHSDVEVLNHMAWAVAFLSRSAVSILQLLVDSGIVARMAQFLRHEDTDVLEATLNTFTELTAGTDEQVQTILSSGFLDEFPKSLGEFGTCANEDIIWILANIAGGPADHIQAIINHGLIRPIIMYLDRGWRAVQDEALRAVYNIVRRGTADQVTYLAEKGVIPPLLRLLYSDDTVTGRPEAVAYALDHILSSGGSFFVDLDA